MSSIAIGAPGMFGGDVAAFDPCDNITRRIAAPLYCTHLDLCCGQVDPEHRFLVERIGGQLG